MADWEQIGNATGAELRRNGLPTRVRIDGRINYAPAWLIRVRLDDDAFRALVCGERVTVQKHDTYSGERPTVEIVLADIGYRDTSTPSASRRRIDTGGD